MKTKLLIVLLVSVCVALAAWRVQRNRWPGFAEEALAQAGEKQPSAWPAKYRELVDPALDYLAKQQHEDGHWEAEDGKYPVATTALVGLALLMEREDGMLGSHKAHVQTAADWLEAQGQPKRDGLIYSGHESETSRYMEGHGLATLFMAGISPNRPRRNEKFDQALARAVRYIEKAQSSRGGWYHTSKAEGHDLDAVLPTAVQLQALQAAENAGIPVSHDVMADGYAYLKAEIERNAKNKAPERTTEIAAFLACHMGQGSDEQFENWLKQCRADLPMGKSAKFGRDDLAHFYYAQATCFSVQKRSRLELPKGDAFGRYRDDMFEHVRSAQKKDGSWPSSDGKTGSIRTTAIWCIILQLGRTRYPSERILEQIEK